MLPDELNLVRSDVFVNDCFRTLLTVTVNWVGRASKKVLASNINKN